MGSVTLLKSFLRAMGSIGDIPYTSFFRRDGFLSPLSTLIHNIKILLLLSTSTFPETTFSIRRSIPFLFSSFSSSFLSRATPWPNRWTGKKRGDGFALLLSFDSSVEVIEGGDNKKQRRGARCWIMLPLYLMPALLPLPSQITVIGMYAMLFFNKLGFGEVFHSFYWPKSYLRVALLLRKLILAKMSSGSTSKLLCGAGSSFQEGLLSRPRKGLR